MIDPVLRGANAQMRSAVLNLEHAVAQMHGVNGIGILLAETDISRGGSRFTLRRIASIDVLDSVRARVKPLEASDLPVIYTSLVKLYPDSRVESTGTYIEISFRASDNVVAYLISSIRDQMANARAFIRRCRNDAVEVLRHYESQGSITKALRRSTEDELQKVADKMVEAVELLGKNKEKEITAIF